MTCALFACGIAARPQASLENALQHGQELLSRGRYREAVAEFNRSKQTAPQDARPYFYAGVALAQAGQLPDSASELAEAVRLAPDRVEYRVFQAHVFAELDQKRAAEDALAAFKDSRALARLSSAWLSLLADVDYRLQMTAEALVVLDAWAAREPRNARIDLDRGQVYVIKGQPDTALEFFQSSIRKSRTNPQAYFELGKILYQRNDLTGARSALVEAVNQDPNNPEYRYRLAATCLALKDTEEALKHLRQAEPAAAGLPEIDLALARAFRAKGDLAQAGEYEKKFEAATVAERERKDRALAADRPIAQGERQLDEGNTAAARSLFEKAVEADPSRWAPRAYLAEMLLSSGDMELAYPHLVKMQELNPDSVIGNYLMASYWYRRKDCQRASEYAEKAKVSRPENSELRHLLGSIYLALGQNEKARQEYEAAVRLAPDRADFRLDLEKVLAPAVSPK